MPSPKKPDASKAIKELLSTHLGGDSQDWKRQSRQKVWDGDIERIFENKALDLSVTVKERSDGLLFAELPGNKELTARLPGIGETFNAAAKPSAVDVVMNATLEDRLDDVPEEVIAEALDAGLARNFSFCVCRYDEELSEDEDEDDINPIYAMIYPSMRDETFKCPETISKILPKAIDSDECMITEWRFSEGIDTPAQIAQHLKALGMTLDTDMQKRQNLSLKDLQAPEKKAGKPKAPKR